MLNNYPCEEYDWFFNNPIEYVKYAWEQWREEKKSLWVLFKEYFYCINSYELPNMKQTLIMIRLLGYTKHFYVWNCNERTAKKYENLLTERLFHAIQNMRETEK